MTKYRINLSTAANASITVETEETDPELIYQEALHEGIPHPCAQCSGWGQNWELEIGDEWDVETDKNGIAVAHRLED
ncbi:hypothetical protein [Streptomyces tsukubensis]|uniref:hypothetical protein n=1 Tax=Streptomyces tsukubensis TaxID=83656 RepID=UPI00344DFFEF